MPALTLTEQQQTQLCNEYIGEALVNDLRAKYGLSYLHFHEVLMKNNVPRRDAGESRRIISAEIESLICKEYLSGGTLRGISRLHGLDRSVIQRVIDQAGIKRHKEELTDQKKVIDRDAVCISYQQTKSASKTAAVFHLSPVTVLRILRKNGIVPITKWTPASNRRKPSFSEEQIQEMVRLYTVGRLSLGNILKRFDSRTGHSNLSKLLRARGVVIRSCSDQNKKYECNDAFFSDPHFPDAYYMLGWLYTDGCIKERPKSYISLELHNNDRVVVEYFRNTLCPTKPLSKTGKDTSIFITHNKAIHADLVRLGLHQNKTKTLQFPTWLRDDLFPHFMRGVLEGDGFFTFGDGKKFAMGFCGASPFVIALADYISKRYGFHLSMAERLGCRNYTLSSSIDALKFAAIIYKDACMICPRKLKQFAAAFEHLKHSKRLSPEWRQECENVINDNSTRFSQIL